MSQQKYKMIAISDFTGGIAHQFNNNLSVVRGFLSLLPEKNIHDEESLLWVKHVEVASEKCIKLTHKLLTYSRYKGISESESAIVVSDYIMKIKKTCFIW